ncbi:hypothetical protein BDV24DRAFT_140599 [Aspergillus arachidicola]|uniref:Quinone oxidoreductase n=1 Tax=Aspergillus arachidicola TaxID=656916 RepID=A0A5N6XXR3_9EURO|nr:hypothetical protein BDV24DRAFT_140599 [Aspergillus arachidicola]
MPPLLVEGGKGPAGSMLIEQIPKPTPGADEVLVEIEAFGVNRKDPLQREGRYLLPP